MTAIRDLTLGEVLEFVAPTAWRTFVLLRWPPDVFAVAATLLHRSGAYTHMLRDGWPPSGSNWGAKMHKEGSEWGALAARNYFDHCAGKALSQGVPAGVFKSIEKDAVNRPDWYRGLHSWWETVVKDADLPLGRAMRKTRTCNALLQICAMADEACRGVGHAATGGTPMMAAVNDLIGTTGGGDQRACSLCLAIPTSRAIVLPKSHTPQLGMTLRALTHHIAFCPGAEIRCGWTPVAFGADHSLNILLIPWPERIHPGQFRACKAEEIGFKIPDEFGHFAFDADPKGLNSVKLTAIIDAALVRANDVDGVIMPELALSSMTEYRKLVRVVLDRLSKNAKLEYEARKRENKPMVSLPRFIIAGVHDEPQEVGRPGLNKAVCTVAYWIDGQWFGNTVSQHKQHSWKLDASQIRTYSLGKQLDPSKGWWEHNELGNRNVQFIALTDWLTMCPVICEDLARPDPLTEMIRAVGPTLVVALLMDAPQLPHRWPGRYATVLADDPGSSVLTVTSAGMIALSSPPPDKPPSRAIGLWKDSSRDVEKIELPPGADAVLLTLSREWIKEWSVDGRHDDGHVAIPGRRKAALRLSGSLPITAAPPVARREAKKRTRTRKN
jgi:hypothetical protein